ncbi:uncharacterized protein LOC112556965 isoform X1 [Pomacea canaliculata]|uniref:uncharacterized protein LOC112556965 isoform X1 n=1 Tax=Pomacea canaliculata TaxID=400727 RepID=UPI000D725C62|nr:uncharacterized protein LOC112556965 isoform X1 [Pomacea canaliculata]
MFLWTTKDFHCNSALSVVTINFNVSEQDSKSSQPAQTLVIGNSSPTPTATVEEADLLHLTLKQTEFLEGLDSSEMLPSLTDFSAQTNQSHMQTTDFLPPIYEDDLAIARDNFAVVDDAIEKMLLHGTVRSNNTADDLAPSSNDQKVLGSACCAETNFASSSSLPSYGKADGTSSCSLEHSSSLASLRAATASFSFGQVEEDINQAAGENGVASDSAIGSQGGIDTSSYHSQVPMICANDFSSSESGQEGAAPASEVGTCDTTISSQGSAASSMDLINSRNEDLVYSYRLSFNQDAVYTASAIPIPLNTTNNFHSNRILQGRSSLQLSPLISETNAVAASPLCNSISDFGAEINNSILPPITLLAQQIVRNAYHQTAISNITASENGRNKESCNPAADKEEQKSPVLTDISAYHKVRNQPPLPNDVNTENNQGDREGTAAKGGQVTDTGSLSKQGTKLAHWNAETVTAGCLQPTGKTRQLPQHKDIDDEEEERVPENSIYEVPGGEEEEEAEAYQDNPSNRPLFEPPPDALYQVEATHAYYGEDEDELSFEAGDIIYVIPFENEDEQDEGWQMGVRQKDGIKGVFPENFTRQL